MESVPVRRKACLLRLRENCPFRKLSRQTCAVSSLIGSYCNRVNPSTTMQPINTVCSQPLSPSRVFSSKPSEVAPDVQMEEDPPAAENPDIQADNCMELNSDVDPETGERAQG